MELILGNKNYSSWSLRPWLAMRVAGITFDERTVPLFGANHRADFDAAFPAGKVPTLRLESGDIWESLAICEYINEIAPEANLWPADQIARAKARAVSAEMASGFVGLRSQYPMNCRRDIPGVTPTKDAARDIARIETIWQECRDEFGKFGPYLFGEFSIADAMYAPVASRFNTYGLASSDISRGYVETLISMPEMKQWYADGKAETWVIETAEL